MRLRPASPLLTGALAALALLAAGPASAQWATLAPLPAPRYAAAVAAFEGKIYVIGGRNASGQILDDALRYDPVANQWSPAGRMDNERTNGAALVFNGQLVVTGGRREDTDNRLNDDVERYDPGSNTWIEIGECYYEREGHAAFAVGTTAYAIGGAGEDTPFRSDAEYSESGAVWQLYPTWTLGIARASFGAAPVGGGLLVIGGHSQFGPIANVDLYVPGLAGQPKQPLTVPRGGLGAAVIETMGGPRVYAVGGRSASSTNPVLARVDVYDPGANVWTEGPALPAARDAAAVVALDGRLYVIGGRDAYGTAVNTAYVLGVTTDVEGGPAEGAALTLGAPAPNPTPGAARLTLTTAATGAVRADVFDVLGRRVATLFDGVAAAGTRALDWDGRDATGAAAPAGVYLVRVEQEGRVAVRRLTVAR